MTPTPPHPTLTKSSPASPHSYPHSLLLAPPTTHTHLATNTVHKPPPDAPPSNSSNPHPALRAATAPATARHNGALVRQVAAAMHSAASPDMFVPSSRLRPVLLTPHTIRSHPPVGDELEIGVVLIQPGGWLLCGLATRPACCCCLLTVRTLTALLACLWFCLCSGLGIAPVLLP